MKGLRASGVEYRRTREPGDFGKVAVLMGGRSSEREVSLKSGNAVLAALLRRGVDAHAFDPSGPPLAALLEQSFDRAWIALHGPGGEDGAIQGALEWLGLPYTGSGVLGSAIAMDKLRTKQLAVACSIPTPPFKVLGGVEDCMRAAQDFGFPMAIKPATQGSSVGMSRVEREEDLAGAWRTAAALDPVVIAEPWIRGQELTVGVLQGEALPVIRIETPRTFYDYQAKYLSDDTRYHIPAGLSEQEEAALKRVSLTVFEMVGALGWGRVDFMMGPDRVPQLLEVNTVPGMTDHSLVPMAAAAAGVDFEELVWRVLETSFAREMA